MDTTPEAEKQLILRIIRYAQACARLQRVLYNTIIYYETLRVRDSSGKPTARIGVVR
jgi:hypothetical protein